ncbi:hypothetical protein SGRIM128S_01305 [Streptomyces griseomycini]
MDMLWSGWGDPAKATPLPDTVIGLLRDLLGVKPREAGPVALEDMAVPGSPLAPDARRALIAALGDEAHVRTDAETRVRHTRGKSTPDLLRIREGDVAAIPAAVLLPSDHDEVLAVLRVCAEHGLPLVPFGGGTSVVGGLAPEPRGAFLALDLRRMDGLLDLDPVSRTATLQPGLRAPQAEALLAAHGFTLGHFPQSYEWATIGGFAATRSSGQASAGYGRFDEMVLSLTLATPEGTLDTGRAPRSAAGPDLRQLRPRIGGRVRRHHLRDRPRPSRPADRRLRRLALPLVRAGGRRAAPDRPGRTAAHRAAPVRRDRDPGRPGEPAGHRLRRTAGRRLHGRRRLRGHGRGHALPQGARRRRPARVRRHAPGRGAGPALGARPLLGPVPARRAPRRRGVRGDAGDGDVLVPRPRAVRLRPRRAHRDAHASPPAGGCTTT